MTNANQTVILIETNDDVSRVRQQARTMIQQGGFSEPEEVRLMTIVSELARNILKYATRGRCEMENLSGAGRQRVRCTFRDQGPGISDVDAALTDGFSTGQTLGVGLPGVNRLADAFHLDTGPSGTVIEVEVHAKPTLKREQGMKRERQGGAIDDPARAGITIRPYKHGRFSGDQAGVWEWNGKITVCMVDGLGHGKDAEVAARGAVECCAANLNLDLMNLMTACDDSLAGSRGAAVALARIDKVSGEMGYVSVGNTRGAVAGREIFHLGGVYGVVGEGVGNARLDHHQLKRRDILLFWTDGMPESLGLVATRLRRVKDARAFANQLIDEHAIDDDDAGVVVLRWDA